jgi:hypothetical protein
VVDPVDENRATEDEDQQECDEGADAGRSAPARSGENHATDIPELQHFQTISGT